MKVIGLVEVHAHDEHGNLLAVSRGRNIMFDNARVAMLLNPCIADSTSDFIMYFSEFKERLIETFYYWDSSLMTYYLTSTITVTSEDLTPYTKMYQFVSQSLLPGGAAKVLRVVGLRSVSMGIYASAVTMDIPVNHGVSTYITGYYKFIMGFNEESELYDNVYNWTGRTWSIVGSYNYKKGFYVQDNSSFDLVSSATIASLIARTQSAYDTMAVNTGLNSVNLFGAKEKDGNTSVALLVNNVIGKNPATRSRTFLHPATSTSLYANLADAIPTSEGSIRIDGIDEFDYNTAVCINITKSGDIGTSEYDVTLLPIAHTLSSRGIAIARRQVNFFYLSGSGNTTYYQYYIYFSENREWAVHYSPSGVFSIWYKGLYRTYPVGTPVWYPGVISNEGVFFYVKTASNTTLRRYDNEKIYEKGYVEETQVLPVPQIRAYQVDDTDSKVITLSYTTPTTIVTNGTFDSNVSGWSMDNPSYCYTTWVSGAMRVDCNYYPAVHTYGVWQDLTTVIGRRYYLSITATACTAGAYGCYIQINGATVLTFNALGTLTYSWVATSTTTRLKILPFYSVTYYWTFDNISVIHTEGTNGTIAKVNIDDMTSYTTYNRTHPNFSALTADSMIFATANDRWYWKVDKGKMVWLGTYSAAKKLHYWDGTNTVSTFDETISGTIYDVCVTDDFKKICYVVQNTGTPTYCTWVVRSLEDGTRWNLLYSVARTIPVNTGYYGTYTYPGCFVSGNYMYQLSASASWGYRTDLVTYTDISYPTYAGASDLESSITHLRTIPLPNRSVISGTLMYGFNSTGYKWPGYPNYTWLFLDMTPLNFGWNGSAWVPNHTGNKITHRDAQALPLYGSVAFGKEPPDDPSTEDYIIGEYFTFSVNPSGYVFDNSMAYTSTPWVYAGVPQYVEGEVLNLYWPNPSLEENIERVLEKVEHPDWLCVEIANIEVVFDDAVTGRQVSSISYLSYYGEYHINAATGKMTFYKSCNGHSVTVNYYWIRRDV